MLNDDLVPCPHCLTISRRIGRGLPYGCALCVDEYEPLYRAGGRISLERAAAYLLLDRLPPDGDELIGCLEDLCRKYP